ncbi:hypothetical protein [Sansalvadorimonas verongulae]|uniref:hypothetical protein n=1 Tax=Sansalvadorimonas verongulae TaxID=2172824 RepID=UPI0012BD4F59|nr:hypothetical protein [Sansalvadorimonas verongulae]MTI13748.1 hypothetical protein [Sansalvadorimonas verongulae]
MGSNSHDQYLTVSDHKSDFSPFLWRLLLDLCRRGGGYFQSVLVFIFFYVFMAHAGLQTPVNQPLGQWELLVPSLQNDLSALTPVFQPVDPPSRRASIRILRLPVPVRETLRSPEGKAVHALKLIDYAYPPHLEEAYTRQGGIYIALEHESGCDLYKPDGDCLKSWRERRRMLPEYGATLDNVYYYPTMGQAPQVIKPEAFQSIPFFLRQHVIPVMTEEFYGKKASSFYAWHRPVLVNILRDSLCYESSLCEDAKRYGAHLFALGCGSGTELDLASRELEHNGIRTIGHGLEINSSLVENAREKYAYLNFTQADASYPASKIIESKKSKPLSSESPTLVLAEGFLTRSVLSGTEAGLIVLQELLQDGVADFVVIGGLASPLVNEHIAKAAGWIATPLMIFYPENIIATDIYLPTLVLRRPAQEEYINTFFERHRSNTGGGEGVVDMSMSAMPWLLIRRIHEELDIDNVKKVDLSFSYFPKDDYSTLLDDIILILASLPSLTHVVLSGRESWLEEFVSKSKDLGKYVVVLRDDIGYKYELPVLEADMRELLLRQRYPSVKNLDVPDTPK